MKQRWALVAMGAWLMGSVAMSVVATENFYTIDRLLAGSSSTAFNGVVRKLGQPEAREVLRYLSSELNRLYFQLWNVAQLAIGGLVLFLIAGLTEQDRTYERGTQSAQSPQSQDFSADFAVFAFKRPVRGVIVMLAIVIFMLVWLTPAIVSLGRSLDFVPRDPAPAGMRRFWILHATYTSLEMLKLIAGSVVTFWIAHARPSNG